MPVVCLSARRHSLIVLICVVFRPVAGLSTTAAIVPQPVRLPVFGVRFPALARAAGEERAASTPLPTPRGPSVVPTLLTGYVSVPLPAHFAPPTVGRSNPNGSRTPVITALPTRMRTVHHVQTPVAAVAGPSSAAGAAAGIGAPAPVGYRPWAVQHSNLFVPFICHVLGVAHNGFPRVRGAFLMVFGDENVLIRLALVYAASYAVRGITVGTVPWAVGHGPLSGDAYIAENDQYPLVEIDNVGHVQFQHYGMLARVAEVFFRLG